jgi:serine/threonine protein kinase
MEFCDGSLDTYLMDRNYSGLVPDFNREHDIFRQIVKGLKYIHNNGIIHGDLSTGNVFLSNGTVKIGDFGLAKEIAGTDDPIATRSYGNRLYLAPERSKHHICSKKSDIYSLGIIFIELFMPFKTVMEKMVTLEAVRQGRYDDLILTPEQLVLAKAMTEVDYHQRPAIEDVVSEHGLGRG